MEVNNRKEKRREMRALMIDDDENWGKKQQSFCKLN